MILYLFSDLIFQLLEDLSYVLNIKNNKMHLFLLVRERIDIEYLD